MLGIVRKPSSGYSLKAYGRPFYALKVGLILCRQSIDRRPGRLIIGPTIRLIGPGLTIRLMIINSVDNDYSSLTTYNIILYSTYSSST